MTREVANLLAQLAKSLETTQFIENRAVDHTDTAQEAPETIAVYLTRCLFSMFAEDVALLPKGSFLGLLKTHRDDPATLQHMLRILWADMDLGGFSAALAKPVLKFNGKLFKHSTADGYSLRLTPAQIDLHGRRVPVGGGRAGQVARGAPDGERFSSPALHHPGAGPGLWQW